MQALAIKPAVLSALLTAAGFSQVTAQERGRVQRPALERARSATVFIEAESQDSVNTGSGFVLTADGLIATAAHVIRGALKARVTLPSGETYDATGILDQDERLDLALIKIPAFGLPTLEFANSDSLEAGDRVWAVGAPLGLQTTVTDGVVSSIRLVEGAKLIQVSVPVSPGSSGGPLLAEDGRTVGIIVSGIRGGGAENLNFARPVNYLRGRILATQGKAPAPLGIAPEAVRPTVISGPLPDRLNDSLPALDWQSVNGAQYLGPERLENKLEAVLHVSYGLTSDPWGKQVIERRWGAVIRTGGMGSQDLGAWTGVTSWVLDTSDTKIASAAEFTPYSSDERGRTQTLSASGGKYRHVDSRDGIVEGTAPKGIVPAEMILGVIAALPDSLPPRLTFWALDASQGQPVLVSAEFGKTRERQIQVAREGAICERGRPRVGWRKLPVTALTLQIGASIRVLEVLATRPHLPIDNKQQCVRIPGLAR